MSDKDVQPIIVKKVIKKGGGHHGGAWKVAYADFVTAMMAFFLLLWLLNVATDEAKNLISSYFDPSHPTVSRRDSGAGGVLGGLSVSEEGAMATNKQPLAEKEATGKKHQGESKEKTIIGTGAYEKADIEKMQAELQRREEARFDAAQQKIEKIVSETEHLKALSNQLLIDMTPEGLRIQIIDEDGEPMFPSGSAKILLRGKELLEAMGPVLAELPNDISIRGHTDAAPMSRDDGYTNWELSADRANASRTVLMDNGLEEERVHDVQGKAAQELLFEEMPLNAQNRRITLLLLNESLEDALERGEFTAEGNEEAEKADSNDFFAEPDPDAPFSTRPNGTNTQEDEGFKKTPGEFYFP